MVVQYSKIVLAYLVCKNPLCGSVQAILNYFISYVEIQVSGVLKSSAGDHLSFKNTSAQLIREMT